MKTNPWTVLGVSRQASSEEIKKQYRRLVMTNHPDRGGDKAKFDEIQQAYDLISDPDKLRDYEQKSNDKPITKLSETVREVVDQFWASATSNQQGDST